MAYFEAAMRRDRELNKDAPNMKYQSYFGLCLARVSEKTGDAYRLCSQAAESEFYNPDVFLNLGKVALLRGDRRRAHDAFRRGLQIDVSHADLLGEIHRLGRRRRPLFAFLQRRHILNRLAGQLMGGSPAST
jgi:Tfp pilus assembly protein PilF